MTAARVGRGDFRREQGRRMTAGRVGVEYDRSVGRDGI